MKEGYLKRSWLLLVAAGVLMLMAIVAAEIVYGVLSLLTIALFFYNHSRFDVEEEKAYAWWQRIGRDKRIEVWKKN